MSEARLIITNFVDNVIMINRMETNTPYLFVFPYSKISVPEYSFPGKLIYVKVTA